MPSTSCPFIASRSREMVSFMAGLRLRSGPSQADTATPRCQWGPRRRSRFDVMATDPQLQTALRWWADGEAVVARHLDGLRDDELAADSDLPDWSRAHVVAHLARNADALVNLSTWARTGVETPMYPSRAARNAGIDATAAQPPAELCEDYGAACSRLAE